MNLTSHLTISLVAAFMLLMRWPLYCTLHSYVLLLSPRVVFTMSVLLAVQPSYAPLDVKEIDLFVTSRPSRVHVILAAGFDESV